MKVDLAAYFLKHGHEVALAAQRGNLQAQEIINCRQLYDRAQDRGSRVLLKQAIAQYEAWLAERAK